MRALLVLSLYFLTSVSCSDNFPVAPDGSRIELTVAPPLVAIDGDSAVITAFVTEADGRPVDRGTRITLTATGGLLCPSATTCDASSLAIVETRDGIATAILTSGRSTVPIVITARSGGISAVANVSISALVAPAGSVAIVEASPDTITVGGTADVHAFITTADGNPVPDATRVVFSTPDTSHRHTIGLTNQGFVSTRVLGKSVGTVVITVQSGSARGADTLVVRP